MSQNSAIEWTDATWNPVRGCTKISPGCKNCYAEAFAERWRGVPGHPYEQGFDLRLVPDKLTEPLSWKKPRMIFVNSMSDLFHEDVAFDYIDRVFAVMALANWHTYQVLTKRAERMYEYFATRTPMNNSGRIETFPQWYQIATKMLDAGAESMPKGAWKLAHDNMADATDPLPNVWLGVSIEDKKFGWPRVFHLRNTPAAVRFFSIEPLLEDVTPLRLQGIHWVIVGGESGHGARRMHPDWVKSIRDQCLTEGVSFFFKQWGEHVPITTASGKTESPFGYDIVSGLGFRKVGKKDAGRILDGREWNQMPKAVRA